MGEVQPKLEGVNEQLRQEILAMLAEDQAMRNSGVWNSEIDEKNTERMKHIIEQYGWPTESLVGPEASSAAWVLTQHADHDLEFQKAALQLLEAAASQGEAQKQDVAFLTDRVRVHSGQSQIFGTQFYADAQGNFCPRPIADMEKLDERRAAYGLEPFDEYRNHMEKRHQETRRKNTDG